MVPVSEHAAEALFRIVDAAYEKRSLAITSNLHPSGFDELMPRTLAAATVDRLLHHAHVIVTEGADSYRLTQATHGKGAVPLRYAAAIDQPKRGENVATNRETRCPPLGRNRWPLTSADLTRRLVERAMSAELTGHLGYEPHREPPGGAANTRNGSTAKTLSTEHGPVEINTPRDRNGSFEPQIVRKGQRRFAGFDDKILALYARGLSTRDIEAHLAEIYGVKVGRDLVSKVTDAVIGGARAWAQRPLEDIYPVLFLDALVLKDGEGGTVQRRACYFALGITVAGDRDVLGMWFQETEGAIAWEYVIPFLAFPPEVRRVIYTTNAIEALNRQLRKAIKTKGRFPNEEAARKLIYLATNNAVPAWTRTRTWTTAAQAFGSGVVDVQEFEFVPLARSGPLT